MSQRQFDLIVVGTGAAGSSAAMPCAKAGWKVAIVDLEPFGGTCALRGCDPKKALRAGAEVIDLADRMRNVVDGSVALNWARLAAFKRSFTDGVPQHSEQSFRDAGISTFHGRARFIDAHTFKIAGETIWADHVVIAAGSMPRPLDFPGAEHLITSTQFMELDDLPARIAFIGGGFISFEFANMAARAGREVHIIDRGPRALKEFEPELSDMATEAARDAGIHVHLNASPTAIEKQAGGLAIRLALDGREETVMADLAVHGAGRVPQIDDLDLDAAGIQFDRKGVVVNDYMQSVSRPHVYAAGDAASTGLPHTPVARLCGEAAAANLLNGNSRQVSLWGIPRVVFTFPPLTACGLTEQEAGEREMEFEVFKANTSGWYSARRVNEKFSFYKIIVERGTGRILGAHLLFDRADEVINLFALAMRLGITAGRLHEAVYAYPTHATDIGYMLAGVAEAVGEPEVQPALSAP